MAKGKKAKAEGQSRLRREIDSRKRRKKLAFLVDEIVMGGDIYVERFAEDPAYDEDMQDENLDADGDGSHQTVEGTLDLDPDDPVDAANLERLNALFHASGRDEITFGPGEFSLEADGASLHIDDDDGDDDEEIIPTHLFHDPLFDQALRTAFPKLVEYIGQEAPRYVQHLLDMAGTELVSVADGEIVVDLDESTPSTEAVDNDCMLFALPIGGPADAVKAALVAQAAEGLFEARFRDLGITGAKSHLRFLPGVVPLEAFHRIGCQGIRMAMACMSAAPIGIDASGLPSDATLLTELGGIPLEAIDHDRATDGYFAGVMIGIRVLLDVDVECDWLFDGMPGDGGVDPGEAWSEWARERYGAKGIDVSIPADFGTAGTEASELLLEGYFTRECRKEGLGPQDRPDQTVLLVSEENVSVFLAYDGICRLVGPLTIPLPMMTRDVDGFMSVLQDVGGGELVQTADAARFEALLSVAREDHAAAMLAGKGATPEPMPVEPADFPPADPDLPIGRTAEVIQFKPRAAST